MMRFALARVTRGLRWSKPQRAAQLLLAFARAEHASHYDMLAAAKGCRDVGRRALYLTHATDEARHAHIFSLRAAELCPDAAAAGHVRADFEHLFERLGELHFLAFVHIGEARGQRQLTLYRDELAQRGDVRTRALLDAILRDEARHVQYTGEQLRRLAGSQSAAQRALAVARAWELWRNLRRLGRRCATWLFVLSMQLVYLSLAPLAYMHKRRQP